MSERRLLVLFGSQTGCAQDVAERVARAAKRRWFRSQVLPMDDYEKVGGAGEAGVRGAPLTRGLPAVAVAL